MRRTLCLKSFSSGSFIMSTQAPVDVELPAVIDAAQAAFLVAPEIQRDAAMRAEFLDQADAALGVAERDEVLAEQADAHRRAVGLGDLARKQRGDPVAAHRVAHRRARADAGDEFVLLARQHGAFLLV